MKRLSFSSHLTNLLQSVKYDSMTEPVNMIMYILFLPN